MPRQILFYADETSTTDKMRQDGGQNSVHHRHQSNSQMCSKIPNRHSIIIDQCLTGAIKPAHWLKVIYCWSKTSQPLARSDKSDETVEEKYSNCEEWYIYSYHVLKDIIIIKHSHLIRL